MIKVIDSFKKEPYRFLSNFYYCKVLYDELLYDSVEHAYQAAKTQHQEEREWIKSAKTPGEAKRRGQKITIKKDWEYVKLGVMSLLVKRKFKTPKLEEKLLATGNAELIEGNYWHDTFWGVCNGKGENHLGKILMQVRKEKNHDNA